jgi:ABC-type cobalt transport system substrate-binding protein
MTLKAITFTLMDTIGDGYIGYCQGSVEGQRMDAQDGE